MLLGAGLRPRLRRFMLLGAGLRPACDAWCRLAPTAPSRLLFQECPPRDSGKARTSTFTIALLDDDEHRRSDIILREWVARTPRERRIRNGWGYAVSDSTDDSD